MKRKYRLKNKIGSFVRLSVFLYCNCLIVYFGTHINILLLGKGKIKVKGTHEATAQWARAFASQAEGWLFESKPRQT